MSPRCLKRFLCRYDPASESWCIANRDSGARELPITDEQPVSGSKHQIRTRQPSQSSADTEAGVRTDFDNPARRSSIRQSQGLTHQPAIHNRLHPHRIQLGHKLIASKVEVEGKSLRLKQ